MIIASGYDQERDANDLLKEGAVAFVQKPYRLASLVGTVQEVIEKGRLRKQTTDNRRADNR
ncbi:MAG: hypothetical protein AABZ15_06090 [Nitrospirota bacterium]